ncbi:MAG: esterase-like activity of phytase family protein [Bacteroidota bacterium]|nr:esterase-like activity of phytase family protein [Bacteroidota bacterium]
MKCLLPVIIAVVLTACYSSHQSTGKTAASSIREIRLINEYVFPSNVSFKNTIIGGLSGIDHDTKRDLYYMNSDDPSSKGPTRYYTARILISEKGIDTVEFIDVNPLLNPQGQPFADITKDRTHSADVEAIRYDPKRDELIWSSEGQRIVRPGQQPELEDPAIVIMDRSGHYKDSFALPANMHIQAEEKGPRHNSVFEGVTFDENYRYVYVSVEEPIYEDGPRAGLGDSTAWIRILKFDRRSKKQVAQFAYQVDPIPYPANPPGAFKINGVSDIMYIGNDKFLVIERAYSTGRIETDVRLYIADAKYAQDISSIASLESLSTKRPVTKKLLLDMNSLGRYIDNIEGATFGPVLPNGHQSLVLVSDDNFDKRQKNQFFLFEVIP